MRTALVLYGNSPFTSKKGTIDNTKSFASFQKHILSKNPGCSVFFHTWDTNPDNVARLLEEYKPVAYASEPYVTTEHLASVSLTMQRAMALVPDSFDLIMLCRFDVLWMTDVDFSLYDPAKFTVTHWGRRDIDPNYTWNHPFNGTYYGTHDIVFVSNWANMRKFCTFADALPSYLAAGVPHCHHITKRYHMKMTGLLDIVAFRGIVGVDLDICHLHCPRLRLYVPNTARSGLGDRMLDLLVYATIGAIRNADVYVQWHRYDLKASDPNWRALDTRTSRIKSFFKLPSWVHLVEAPPPEPYEVWPRFIGGVIPPHEFCKQQGAEFIDVRSSFGMKIPSYLSDVPYTVVHLRRTDKLRGFDMYMIDSKELPQLDQLTQEAIQKYSDKTVYVASDDASAKVAYETWLRDNGYTVIQPPNTHSLLPSYFDLWMMWSASRILVSMKYTTFSLLPALLQNIPIHPVLGTELYEKFEPLVHYVDPSSKQLSR